ncbi:aquaporin [Streptomyces sp. NPDC004658]|uniref:MIP/aquaporin family protein n=1 Tax=Streptomyces sp. NPDC004658 TaxID=3154672 RepID=UPI0033AE199B
MTASARRPAAVPTGQVWCEFALTTVLLFLVVTIVRWVRVPASPLYVGDLRLALAVVGPVAGLLITGLILSPWGRRSGGHMNPAVTVAVWLMDVFPGVSVLPYIAAQLAGSVLGASLGRLVWGPVVSTVGFGALRPAPAWPASAVFLAETGSILVLALAVGFLLAYPAFGRWLPATVGVCIALIIVILGPLSGGSANPARQFGPALLAGRFTDLVTYMVAPILGAVLGASVHHLLYRRFQLREPITYKLAGTGDAAQSAETPRV